jgi:hypothetical protein
MRVRTAPPSVSLGVYLDKSLILKILILSYLRARKSNDCTNRQFAVSATQKDPGQVRTRETPQHIGPFGEIRSGLCVFFGGLKHD